MIHVKRKDGKNKKSYLRSPEWYTYFLSVGLNHQNQFPKFTLRKKNIVKIN